MKNYLFALLLLLLPLSASARLYAIRDSVANGYNFWLYVPKQYKDYRADRAKVQSEEVTEKADSLVTEKVDSLVVAKADSLVTEKVDSLVVDSLAQKRDVPAPLPIVVFLHGRSLSGTDLNIVRKYGTIDAISRGRNINAIVIAPQVTMSDWWRPNRVMNIVKWVSERYDVDMSRLYVLGMSLGGYGAIDFAAAYPNETAAAMGLCGGATRKDLANINEVPMWIIHGTSDVSVSVTESRRVKAAMEEGDATTPRLRYDEYPGVGHAALARLFYLKETYEWLFKHSTTDPSRPVDRTVKITQDYAINRSYAYQGLHAGSGNLKIEDPLSGGSIPASTLHTPTSAETTAVASSKSTTSKPVYHTLQSGETISHLAVKYGTTTKKIKELNPGLNPDKVKVGQKICVKKESSSKSNTSSSKSNTKSTAKYHTLLSGETISHLAVKYGTTTKKIKELNPGLNPDKVRDGQKIRVK